MTDELKPENTPKQKRKPRAKNAVIGETQEPEVVAQVKRGHDSQPKRDNIGEKSVSRSRIAYDQVNKLNVDGKDPNYEYRWVNTDEDKWRDRIDNLKKRGYIYDYETETSDGGVEASSIGSVNSKPAGNGTKAVLMKIKKDYFEEDKRLKAKEVDRREEGMKRDIEKLKNADLSVGEGLKMS